MVVNVPGISTALITPFSDLANYANREHSKKAQCCKIPLVLSFEAGEILDPDPNWNQRSIPQLSGQPWPGVHHLHIPSALHHIGIKI
jgi:hypothetical protein